VRGEGTTVWTSTGHAIYRYIQVQCSAEQHSTVQNSTYSTVQCSTVQYSTVRSSPRQYSIGHKSEKRRLAPLRWHAVSGVAGADDCEEVREALEVRRMDARHNCAAGKGRQGANECTA